MFWLGESWIFAFGSYPYPWWVGNWGLIYVAILFILVCLQPYKRMGIELGSKRGAAERLRQAKVYETSFWITVGGLFLFGFALTQPSWFGHEQQIWTWMAESADHTAAVFVAVGVIGMLVSNLVLTWGDPIPGEPPARVFGIFVTKNRRIRTTP